MGILHTKEELKALSHVTGFISWAVALGDLLVSCTAECRAQDREPAKAGTEKTTASGENPDVFGTRPSPEYDAHGIAPFPTGLPPGPESIGVGAAAQATPVVATAAPASGDEHDVEAANQDVMWNSAV